MRCPVRLLILCVRRAPENARAGWRRDENERLRFITTRSHSHISICHGAPDPKQNASGRNVHVDKLPPATGKPKKVHQPGIEPGSHRWQRCILPLDH